MIWKFLNNSHTVDRAHFEIQLTSQTGFTGFRILQISAGLYIKKNEA